MFIIKVICITFKQNIFPSNLSKSYIQLHYAPLFYFYQINPINVVLEENYSFRQLKIYKNKINFNYV